MSQQHDASNVLENQVEENDIELNIDDDVSETETEYEEYDLTENPLYQVLSAFFENDEGENICDHLAKLTHAVNLNTKSVLEMQQKLLEVAFQKKKISRGKNN